MHGRALVHGSMGSGKKVIAIGASIIDRPDWPLLIVCPRISQLRWRDEFKKLIPRLNIYEKLQIVDL
jgi:hypothetical protein